MRTWWHHKAKAEHVGGVKIQEANEYTQKEKTTANQKPKQERQSRKTQKIKTINKKETSFPIRPGGGSRLSGLSRDWSVLETAVQNRSEVLLMSCFSGQSESVISHHHRGDAHPHRAGALPLVGSDLLVKRSWSHGAPRRSTRHLPQCLALCGGGV